MSINTKEQLKTHIHKIHNLIRNSGAGYGLDALKIFNFFYGLKVLEPFWDEYGLESAKFSKLVEIAKKANTPEKESKLYNELFVNKENKKGCLYELFYNNKLNNIIVSKINDALKTNFYKQIILEINKIPTINNKQKTDVINDKFDVDIKGKTYEYFIGRDKQAISDLGAYFSDRHFTNFAINIVKPELTDGQVPLYIDPFGGSGGFTISFVNYLKTKYPKLNEDDELDIHNKNFFTENPTFLEACEAIYKYSIENIETTEYLKDKYRLINLIETMHYNKKIDNNKLNLYFNIVKNDLLEYHKTLNLTELKDETIIEKMNGAD
jgi:hypothetical protein